MSKSYQSDYFPATAEDAWSTAFVTMTPHYKWIGMDFTGLTADQIEVYLENANNALEDLRVSKTYIEAYPQNKNIRRSLARNLLTKVFAYEDMYKGNSAVFEEAELSAAFCRNLLPIEEVNGIETAVHQLHLERLAMKYVA